MKSALFFMLFIVIGFFYLLNTNKKTPILHLNMKKEPKTMDPRKGEDMYSTQMHSLLFEGLVKVYPDGSIKLAQANSYEVSEDKLIYTFHLRDTVWSNKTPVTAYDFEQSWKDILNPDFPSMNAELFSPIKNADAAKKGLLPLDEVGIKAIDNKTLIITLEKPTPYLLKLLAFRTFYPVNIKNDRKNPNWADKPGSDFLCNGPFILEKWDHENQIIAKRNPKYRKTEDLHPSKIIFTIIEDDMITLQMFEKGLVDIIGDCLTHIPLEAIPLLENKWTFSYEPTASTVLISINTDKPPFHHSKIRRAFGLAINRQALIRSFGKDVKKNSLKHPINIAYQASLGATNMIPPCLKENRHRSFFKDNDVETANILLEEGLKELNITKKAFDSVILYYYYQSSGTSELIQAIQQQWLDALGVFIKIECLDFRNAVDKLSSGDYSMCFMHWEAMYHDPMSLLERFKYKTYSTNFSNWENLNYIQLLDQSFYEQADTRLLTLEKAEKLFLSEMPFIPLYHEDYVYIINPRLPFAIPVWWGDRMLLPLSSEEQKVQKENKRAYLSKSPSYSP